MKTYKVRVSYTGWDWRDIYTMKSPSGRSLQVIPNGHWQQFSRDELAVLALIKGLYDEKDELGNLKHRWCDQVGLEVTCDQMKAFKSASEITE